MNRYFVYSGAVHFVLFAAFMLFMNVAVKPPQAVYTIDFLGASFQSASAPAKAEAAAAQSEVKAPETAKEEPKPAEPQTPVIDKKIYAGKTEISEKAKPKKQEKIVLDAPSVLTQKTADKKPAAAQPGAANANAQALAENAFGIKTDFPNFPYPWYITQVKNSLWTEWQKRKPANVLLIALVSFSINKQGAVKDIKISKKSGNDIYDFAASAAVSNAAPFPPLPEGFEKNELTVTVEFRDE